MLKKILSCCLSSKKTNTYGETNTNISDSDDDPTHIQYKDTVPFVPPVSGGEVIKVYDGDTITIAAKLPYPESPLYRFNVRLNGIDAPEIKSKSKEESICAELAKQALTDLILHKTVILKNQQTEKYGRLLADVYVENLHVNQWLLNNWYAVPYDGKTKKSPKSWANYKTRGTLF